MILFSLLPSYIPSLYKYPECTSASEATLKELTRYTNARQASPRLAFGVNLAYVHEGSPLACFRGDQSLPASRSTQWDGLCGVLLWNTTWLLLGLQSRAGHDDRYVLYFDFMLLSILYFFCLLVYVPTCVSRDGTLTSNTICSYRRPGATFTSTWPTQMLVVALYIDVHRGPSWDDLSLVFAVADASFSTRSSWGYKPHGEGNTCVSEGYDEGTSWWCGTPLFP
jgi:hypothetical protein